MLVKIILYILIGFAILFGLYKMFIDDEKGVGYASFIFAVLVFLLTLIPTDEEDRIDKDQSANSDAVYVEEEKTESKDENSKEENRNESDEGDIDNQEDEQYTANQSEPVAIDQVQDKMVYLGKLDYFNSSNSSGNAFRYYESAKDNLGFTYGNGIGGVAQGENWQEYKLSGKYKEIQGRVILNFDYRTQTNDDVLIKIYGDDMLLYMSPVMAAGQEPVDFNIDISDIDVLKVSIVGENMIRLVDCVLYDSFGNQSKEYQDYVPDGNKIYLQNFDYIASSNTSGNGFRFYDTVTDNLGLVYGNGLGGVGQGENWQDYKLNGKYKEFQARVVLNYDYRSQVSDDVLVKIYGDDVLLYISPIMSAGQEPVDIDLDITGVDILRVSIIGKNMVRLVDSILYTSVDNESKEYKYNSIDKDIVSLHLLDYFSSSNASGAAFSYYSSVKDNMNNAYADGIGGKSAYLNWQEYKVYGNYNSIQGKIILNYDYREQESSETYVNIYGDTNLLYTSPLITAGQQPVEFNVNIEGIDKLRISIEGRNMIRIVECYLKKAG
ncbi:MAG: NPCBM/NEW2 domain-containing protein [Lachnospiraceae bacterium]|nr:NPCBM/NEW2 domain-containing protein [Lachnospiraceae bacterium]